MGKAKLDYDVLSDFELIEIFKSEYERIKPSGCVDFYNNTDIAPSLYIITKRLKMKWNDMLIFIGVDEDKILFKRIDKEDCIRILHEIYKTEGKTPTAQDLINNGHCAQTFKKNFGSFSNALECAGLTPNKSPTKVTEDKRELLEQYIKLSKMLGRPANHKDIVESNFMHNPSVYTIRFGGIGGLRKAAGLEQLLYDSNKYTKDKVVRLLNGYINKKSGIPSVREITDSKDLPSHLTILSKFDTTKMSEVWKQLNDDSGLTDSN